MNKQRARVDSFSKGGEDARIACLLFLRIYDIRRTDLNDESSLFYTHDT